MTMSLKKTNKNRLSLKMLDQAFNHKSNVLKISRNNTLHHELAKFFLAWEILQAGGDFVSEAIFTNGKRSDIFNLELCEAWEVVHSESDRSIENKKEQYPCKVLKFKSKDIVDFWITKIMK